MRGQPDLPRLRYFKLYEMEVIFRVADQEVWDTSSGEGVDLQDGPVTLLQPPQVFSNRLIEVFFEKALLLRLVDAR